MTCFFLYVQVKYFDLEICPGLLIHCNIFTCNCVWVHRYYIVPKQRRVGGDHLFPVLIKITKKYQVPLSFGEGGGGKELCAFLGLKEYLSRSIKKGMGVGEV